MVVVHMEFDDQLMNRIVKPLQKIAGRTARAQRSNEIRTVTPMVTRYTGPAERRP
jgi:hypothetical protein